MESMTESYYINSEIKIKKEKSTNLERRRHTDIWSKLLFYLNIVSWIMIGIILFVFHKAQPEYETVFDRFYQLQLRTNWDLQYVYYLIYVVVFGILLSIAGIVLGIYRGRRKQDHKKVLILTGILSTIALITSLTVVK